MLTNTSILKFITGYINRKRYGIQTGNLSSDPLLNTYSQNSGCGYDEQCMHLQPCEDDIVFKICNFSIDQITKTDIDYNKVKFSIPAFHNGIEPYTTKWTFDQGIYSLVESTASYVILNRLLEAVFDTEISVKITDITGCIALSSLPVHFEPIPFVPAITCAGITYSGNFIKAVASSGTITVPYSIQGYGSIVISIDSNTDGFSGFTAPITVTPGTGSTTFPIQYSGIGDAGTKNIPVKLSYLNSADTCDAHITVSDPPIVVACSIPLNVSVEEEFDDSDSDSDSDIVTCDPITIVSGLPLSDANEGVNYTQSIELGGEEPYVLNVTTIPSWMTAEMLGTTLVLGGTPPTPATGLPVVISVTNCEGEHSVDINETIDVIEMINITGNLTNTDNSLTINLASSMPCDTTFTVYGTYFNGSTEIPFTEDVIVLAGATSGTNSSVAIGFTITCINTNVGTNLVGYQTCSGVMYKVTLGVPNNCP